MRLAIIRQRYNPYGGAERFIERAVTALRVDGAAITVVAREWPRAAAGGRDGGGASDAAAVSTIICNPFFIGRLWRDIGFAHAVCGRLETEQFDVVQSHERLACCDIFRAGDGVHRQWLANRARVQSPLARLATRLNPSHLYLLAAERRTFASPRLRAVICNSQMVREEIERHFGIEAARLKVIYNGVDLTHFHPSVRQVHRAATRAALSIDPAAMVYLFVGSGFARKGLPRLLRAFASGAPRSAQLVVVGADKSMSEVQAAARSLGVAARAHFLGGKSDVRPYYATADCFALPTLYDPFPNAAIEALACGLPVITSEQSGAAELIGQGVNGFVCSAFDEQAVTQAVRAAPSLLTEEAGRAARRSVEHLSVEAMAERLRELYMSLMP